MCSPLIYGFWKSNRRLLWGFGFSFSIWTAKVLQENPKGAYGRPKFFRSTQRVYMDGQSSSGAPKGCIWTAKVLQEHPKGAYGRPKFFRSTQRVHMDGQSSSGAPKGRIWTAKVLQEHPKGA